jgi:UDP-N-acetylmuramoylalanine--D-glutamate ligase
VDHFAYRQPVLCAAAAAIALGIEPAAIGRGLESFDGVPGRMKYEALEGRRLLDNSSSGLSLAGVKDALLTSSAGGRRVLVVGEEKYNVCEGLPPAGVLEIARSVGTDGVVLVGERLKSMAMLASYGWAPGLKGGIAAALSMTGPGDMIISCVKTWR